MIIRKVSKNGTSLALNLPKNVWDQLGVNRGEYVKASLVHGGLFIEKLAISTRAIEAWRKKKEKHE